MISLIIGDFYDRSHLINDLGIITKLSNFILEIYIYIYIYIYVCVCVCVRARVCVY